jgi:energy-converting hydrogenase Eha subunit E
MGGGISIYIGLVLVVWFSLALFWNSIRKSGVLQGSLYLSRESLGNSIFTLFRKHPLAIITFVKNPLLP